MVPERRTFLRPGMPSSTVVDHDSVGHLLLKVRVNEWLRTLGLVSNVDLRT